MATPGRISQPNDIELTGGAVIGPPSAVNAGKVAGVSVDLTGLADGDTLVYDGATSTLKPGAGGTGSGIDLTGRAKGDLLVVNHDGDGNPVASWLPIGAAGQVLYVTPALMPAWGTPSGGVTGVRLLSPDGSPLLSPDSSPLVTTS